MPAPLVSDALWSLIAPLLPVQPARLHAAKAYDFRRCRRACQQRGIKDRISRRRVDTSQKLARRRWVVERTFAWLNRFRRPPYATNDASTFTLPFTTLACSVICLRAFGQWF